MKGGEWGEVEEQRRIQFWQRVYLQTLGQLMAPLGAVPGNVGGIAGQHASEAVRQLDQWMCESPPAEAEETEAGDDGDYPDDAEGDPEGQYLGR